jgi:hypothetical protein
MLVPIYKIIWNHIPEGSNFDISRNENLISCVIFSDTHLMALANSVPVPVLCDIDVTKLCHLVWRMPYYAAFLWLVYITCRCANTYALYKDQKGIIVILYAQQICFANIHLWCTSHMMAWSLWLCYHDLYLATWYTKLCCLPTLKSVVVC